MGGERVHVTCMLSKFSARHAGSHRKCVLPRVLGRQGPQSGAQRSSWTLRPEERGCWSCKATWTQSRVTWRQGPETRKQAPPPARSTGWGWGTGAEPVAAGSRALGLREAPPSPAGHPPWLSQHPAGPNTNFLLTGTSSEELLLFASKELLTKLGKNITFKLVL